MMIPLVTLPSGETLPALGLGTWKMGEDAATREAEIAATKATIALGFTIIDAAEMTGNGRAETAATYTALRKTYR